MKTKNDFSMKQSRPLFFSLLIFVSLFLDIAPAFAQDGNPPFVDPNGAWGEVVNADGSINYANLTDGGVVTQPAEWMPSIPGVGPVDAEYHVYTTPSGNTILMPTAIKVGRQKGSSVSALLMPMSFISLIRGMRSKEMPVSSKPWK